MRNIPTTSFVIDSWGRLGFRSNPTGLSIPEAITLTITFSFFRFDKLVYTKASLRPISPCQGPISPCLFRQWHDLSFLTSGIPIRPFQEKFKSFTDNTNKSWGTQMGILDPFRPQAHQHFGAQGGNFGPKSLFYNISLIIGACHLNLSKDTGPA